MTKCSATKIVNHQWTMLCWLEFGQFYRINRIDPGVCYHEVRDGDSPITCPDGSRARVLSMDYDIGELRNECYLD